MLNRVGREITGAELSRLMGVAPTAMNNRLSVLGSYGLASSRVDGRCTFWIATPTILQKRTNREHGKSLKGSREKEEKR
jgi:hypothetical protein